MAQDASDRLYSFLKFGNEYCNAAIWVRIHHLYCILSSIKVETEIEYMEGQTK